MFTDHISIGELQAMLQPRLGLPAWPELDDPAVRRQAQADARRVGLWDALPDGFVQQGQRWAQSIGHRTIPPRAFDPRVIPAFRRSDRLRDAADGATTRVEHAFRYRYYAMSAMATALWLEHPAGDIDYLQDSLWSWCDTMVSGDIGSETMGADLYSAALASDMAEFVFLFGDHMDGAVTARVAQVLEAQVLQRSRDYRLNNWWLSCRHNWNCVVLSQLIATACYLLTDAAVLAYYIHPLIENLKYGLEGFTDDGGCTEGPGYWWYGFEHFLDAAIMLHHRTGGGVDLVGGNAKIERISRYPLAAFIDGPTVTCWADADHGYVPARVIFKINRFFDLPELFTLCRRDERGVLLADDADNYRIWRTLTLYRDIPQADTTLGDAYLPVLGQAKVYAPAAPTRTALAALAGHNGVNHNHNDIGTFIYYAGGTCLLTDPGASAYTHESFGPRRYECLYNNSFGHSVPVINGHGQREGAEHYGDMQVDGLGGDDEKTVAIDFTHAYDDATLQHAHRTFTLAPDGALTLTDRFRFTVAPSALQEAFITYEQASLTPDGAVALGDGAAVLRAVDTAGHFTVQRLEEESKAGRGQGVITRILFTPAELREEMEVKFTILPIHPAVISGRIRE